MRGRVRGSIESPLRRVSAGVARWNHAAAGGLFSVYICRSITLDPVGCRPPIPEGSMLRQGECSEGRGTDLGSRGSRAEHFGTRQNLRGIRTLDRIPLFEQSASDRQMFNNDYAFRGWDGGRFDTGCVDFVSDWKTIDTIHI